MNPTQHTSPSDTSEITMTPFLATSLVEGLEPDATEEQLIEAWQYLHNTGLAYRLQGWYGRTATSLIESGVINA
jgi:hypothetical protein